MNYKKTAEHVLNHVGGRANVAGLTHCATRLRFTLNDGNKVNVEALKQTDGVIDVMKSAGQYQVIIGTDVANVAHELNVMGVQTRSLDEEHDTKNMKLSDKFFDTVSGIFTPIIPALTAAGMLKAVLVLLNVTKVLTAESQTYQILSFVSDTAFYFLPVFVAVSTAIKLKCNPYIAGMMGAMLIHPNFIAMVGAKEPVSFLGFNVPLVSYASSVIPSILAVWFMSYAEKFADKVSPKAVKFLLRPLLTVLIVVPVTLLVFGPLGSYVGNALAYGADFINTHVPWLMATLMGAFFPLLVLTGMHWSFVPIIVQSYATYNYEAIMGPGSFVSNICQGAVALAVGFKTKNTALKQTSISAGVTALLGITEPALFGVTIKFKNALYAVMAGGAVGGLYAGLQGVVRYTSGTPGLASFAVFIGENPMNLVHALISVLIGFIVTFILTWMFVNPDTQVEATPKDAPKTFSALEKETILSPIQGTVVDIKEVSDPTFANEIIGKGVAVYPTDGHVYAPFDGTVQMVFSTGHAIGLVNENGVEVLVHVGIDTVKLEGQGFNVKVKQGDMVKAGQELVSFDIDFIKNSGYDVITPVILTNLPSDANVVVSDKSDITNKDPLLVIL